MIFANSRLVGETLSSSIGNVPVQKKSIDIAACKRNVGAVYFVPKFGIINFRMDFGLFGLKPKSKSHLLVASFVANLGKIPFRMTS